MYWPGTNIIKSFDNDFNWKTGDTDFSRDFGRHLRQSQAGKENSRARSKAGIERGEPFYITPAEKPYQKSLKKLSAPKPTVFNGKGNKV